MARVLSAHYRQLSGGGHMRHVTHAGRLVLKVHGDARIDKAHHGAHAHTCRHNGIHAVLRQKRHRTHAATFLMRRVLDDAHLAQLAVLNVNDGKAIAMTKMPRALAVEPARAHGWNSNLHAYQSLFLHVARHVYSTPRCIVSASAQAGKQASAEWTDGGRMGDGVA